MRVPHQAIVELVALVTRPLGTGGKARPLLAPEVARREAEELLNGKSRSHTIAACAMSLPTGTRLGAYEIVSPLGAGGMGEVYRARDTKLGREVAIKVLPEAVEKDPERIARFEREAKALAALNHPNIAALFGMEQSERRHFLVMELVEGATLAERLSSVGSGSGLPVPVVLAIARQVADALEAAHERGIVHRDLKPANIKVTPDEAVKVLDFGLAKAMDGAGGTGGDGIANSPTITTPAMTEAGVILGTAAYMSPEQAQGMPTDHRSDVFSFGCVLYELLTGRKAFAGETVADMLASVLAREPDWSALPSPIGPRLTSLLRRCLAKSRRQRWQAIGDVRAEIEFIIAEPAAAPPPSTLGTPRPPWTHALIIAATAALASALAGWLAWTWKPAATASPVVRFPITLASDQALYTNFNRQILSVSRDGTQIAYSADHVYLRPISEATAQPVPGSEAFTYTTHPAFSPDGRSIVFWAQTDRTLKRLTLGSSPVVTLCPLSEGGLGLAWAGDFIYFADSGKGIKRVSANGGQPEAVVTLSGREEVYGPQVLPDGDTVLFTLGTRGMASWDEARVVAQSLRTGRRRTLVERATDAKYVPSGHLLFGRGGVIFAVPFDLKKLATIGEPVAVVEGVRRAAPGTTGAVHFAVSDTGTLAYLPGSVSASGMSMQMALFDRAGAAEPLRVPLGPYNHPRVSPDGTWVAVGTDDGKDAQVWIYGLSKSSAARRLTFGGSNAFAEWSADGQRVAFQSNREGDAGIWWQRADGTDTATRLTRAEPGVAHVPQSWSPDGRHLLFDAVRNDRVSVQDFSLADKKAAPFSSLVSDVPSGATFSPDGRWVAYAARKDNPVLTVAYVEPYPPTGARYQVSKDSEDGHHPLWSRNGRELFYTPGPGNRFLSVSVSTAPAFSFGDAVLIPRMFTNAPPSAERTYDITRDGTRFLGLRTDVGTDGLPVAPQIQVVLNWTDELKRRVPVSP